MSDHTNIWYLNIWVVCIVSGTAVGVIRSRLSQICRDHRQISHNPTKWLARCRPFFLVFTPLVSVRAMYTPEGWGFDTSGELIEKGKINYMYELIVGRIIATSYKYRQKRAIKSTSITVIRGTDIQFIFVERETNFTQ